MTSHSIRPEPPIYTAENQGADQDRDTRALATERHLAYQRTQRGVRQQVAAELRGEEEQGTHRAALDAAGQRPSRAGRGKAPPLNDTDEAFIYARVSTREQARTGGGDEGYSIPYQRDACRTKAEAPGAAVVGEYVDAGESAKTIHRPQLQQMLKDIKKRQVRYLIVHKVDRLARNRKDDMAIRLTLRGQESSWSPAPRTSPTALTGASCTTSWPTPPSSTARTWPRK